MSAARFDVLIDVSPGEVRAAWLDEDGVLQRFEMERLSMPSLVGGVYLGRVAAVEKNMDAAFLEIGAGEHALLRRAKGVTEGQRLAVQVTHDAGLLKGPTVSRHPAVVGRWLRYRADQHGIQWSRGLGQGRARAGLEKALAGVLPRKGGFSVRSAAVEATPEEVAAEMERLTARAAEIEELAHAAKSPGELVPPVPLIERVLRDHVGGGDIVIDDRLAFAAAKRSAWVAVAGLKRALKPYDRTEPLFEAAGVADQLADAVGRIVPLAGGGNLVFDRTEAMTVVDVNLGDAAHRPPRDDAALTLNKAAAAEIGRHIRVRNLSGLIAVDFISMRNKAHRGALLTEMRRRLAGDRVAADVLGITPGGVMEITRQRAGRPLAEFYQAPPAAAPRPHPHAAACHGLRHALRLTGPGRPVLRADPAVIAALKGPLAPALEETGRRLGQPLTLVAEPGRMDPYLEMER